MERSDGQKSKTTTHKANGLDESAYSGAKTVFEGQATGEEDFKADETYHCRIAPQSERTRSKARSSSLKRIPDLMSAFDPKRTFRKGLLSAARQWT